MNRTKIIMILLLGIVSCGKNKFNNYGAMMPSQEVQSYGNVFKDVQNGQIENVSLKGEIIKTCPKKGCWMDVKVSETDTIKVRFKDYGFFVPKEGMEGKQTIFKGEARMDTISIEMLRHYAEDAGKPQEAIQSITSPEYVMQVVAEGVLIER